jgi:ubiquitin-protein ligase
LSSPRLRRLAADYEAVRAEFSGHPHVRVEPLGQQRPPETYRVTYRVRGLMLVGDTPQVLEEHGVEIQLTLGYPRDKPRVRALTPIFHPNVREEYCIQDYWAAGQSLVDTISKIADMIQFRIYNPASPLDALAARWTQENERLLPLGNVTLASPEVEIHLGGRFTPAARIEQMAPPDAAVVELKGRA